MRIKFWYDRKISTHFNIFNNKVMQGVYIIYIKGMDKNKREYSIRIVPLYIHIVRNRTF